MDRRGLQVFSEGARRNQRRDAKQKCNQDGRKMAGAVIHSRTLLYSQIYNRDGLSPALFGLKRSALHKRMRFQKFRETLAQRAGSVPVDNSHARLIGERGFI